MFGALSCVMTFDASRCLRRLTAGIFIICAVISVLLGGCIELVQDAMSAGRSGEWADLAADTLGAFLLPLLFWPFLQSLVRYYTLSLHDLSKASRIPSAMHKLYIDSFPPDERRPWTDIEMMTDSSDSFHFTLLKSGGAPAGFITWWNLQDGIYVEHFAIEPARRSHGLGALALGQFCSDHGHKPIVLEAEPSGSNPMANRRINFYERCGFTSHPEFEYIQPPYSPGLNPVRLTLMTYGTISDLGHLATELKQKVYGVK